jgi:subtilase family serine protease
VSVLHISGLDNLILPHSCLAPDHSGFSPTPDDGSGPNGTYAGYDFRAAYAPRVALTGAGQVVGLFQLDGYYASDITAYETTYGLPNVPLQNVLLDGFSGVPGSSGIKNAVKEVSLDIEMVIAMAPGLSKVIVYEGKAANSVLNRMATDHLASQLSASWQYPIDSNTEQIYQQFASQGQSFLNSSGDIAAYCGAVATPSDDPYITVVGGTFLVTSGPVGSWLSEKTWHTSLVTNGTGGGISTTYPIPKWQQGVDMSASGGSTAMRNLPDVAMVASGVSVIFSNGVTAGVNGTSIAAPLCAGFAALVNQQCVTDGHPTVGFLNPALYTIGKGAGYTNAFHDITVGNNTNCADTTKYFAVPGYDLCTGWGTPTGSNLINALEAFAGAVWVDFGSSAPGIGTYEIPYNTLARGVAGVLPGGNILIKAPGSRRETNRITKALTLRAVGGTARIGR